jgi:hypothetical protein
MMTRDRRMRIRLPLMFINVFGQTTSSLIVFAMAWHVGLLATTTLTFRRVHRFLDSGERCSLTGFISRHNNSHNSSVRRTQRILILRALAKRERRRFLTGMLDAGSSKGYRTMVSNRLTKAISSLFHHSPEKRLLHRSRYRGRFSVRSRLYRLVRVGETRSLCFGSVHDGCIQHRQESNWRLLYPLVGDAAVLPTSFDHTVRSRN